jgi:hypothetical protein
MKNKEEIEQLAEKEYPIQLNENHYKPDVYDDLNEDNRNAYVEGYNQCQEDMADKKYTEEDMLKCWNTAFTDAMNIDSETYKPIFYSDFINSLNKQD